MKDEIDRQIAIFWKRTILNCIRRFPPASLLRDRYDDKMLDGADSIIDRVVRESGLYAYFHHIEVMERKSTEDYLAMAAKLDIAPEEILMVGNSVKSDIAPVVSIGGTAIHVPHEVTWAHEMMDIPASDRVIEVKNIKEILGFLL